MKSQNRSTPAISWSEEEASFLYSMWEKGASDAQIAQELTLSIRPRGVESVRSFRERAGLTREPSLSEPNVRMNDAFVFAMELAGYPLGSRPWSGSKDDAEEIGSTVPHRSLPTPMSYGSGWQA